jgi:hypothetical protein
MPGHQEIDRYTIAYGADRTAYEADQGSSDIQRGSLCINTSKLRKQSRLTRYKKRMNVDEILSFYAKII